MAFERNTLKLGIQPPRAKDAYSSAAMSADHRPSLKSNAVEEALAAIRRSQPSDYDGHTEFEKMTPDARLKSLEAAVRFVQSSKSARRAATGHPLILYTRGTGLPAVAKAMAGRLTHVGYSPRLIVAADVHRGPSLHGSGDPCHAGPLK